MRTGRAHAALVITTVHTGTFLVHPGPEGTHNLGTVMTVNPTRAPTRGARRPAYLRERSHPGESRPTDFLGHQRSVQLHQEDVAHLLRRPVGVPMPDVGDRELLSRFTHAQRHGDALRSSHLPEDLDLSGGAFAGRIETQCQRVAAQTPATTSVVAGVDESDRQSCTLRLPKSSGQVRASSSGHGCASQYSCDVSKPASPSKPTKVERSGRALAPSP